MCRCRICNRADFDTAYCVDDLDLQPSRNSIHYYADLGEWLCSYCHRQITKNRKFYKWYFNDDKFKQGLDAERPKQKNKKTTPKVPEPQV